MRFDAHELVRRQFGANAAKYATSVVHAKGASLGRLVELLAPAPEWRLLDVATAAGHTAFAFAPHVAEVMATDLVGEMAELARRGAEERELDNVTVAVADAEAMPFEDGIFDAVTCRIAAHHFPHPERFVAEVTRVLRPGGRFGLVDNMVAADAADFVDRWERRRDPSHVRALPLEEWLSLLAGAGLRIDVAETMAKRMRFETWADTMSVPGGVRAELLSELERASPPAVAYLRPDLGAPGDQAAAAFHLTEGIVVASKPAT